MSGVYLGSDSARLYLGDIPINVGEAVLTTKSITANGSYAASSDNADGYSSVNVNVAPNVTTKTITQNGTYNASSDNADGYSSVTVAVPQPTITTTTAAADLTGYEAGDTSLGNDWQIVLGSTGTAVVGSETVGGVTYEGLEIGGSTTIAKAMGLTGDYQVLEIEIIETALTYDSYYGTVRVISTESDFRGSLYLSSSSDYLHFCTGAATWRADSLVTIDSDNAYDTSVTKSDIMNQVLNVKYINDGDYITMYVNGVRKLVWSTSDMSPILQGYGIHVGADGIGENGMFVSKAEYRGDSLTWDGRTWRPA